jgi:hypothetical protein
MTAIPNDIPADPPLAPPVPLNVTTAEIAVRIPQQTRDNWCWAAVAAGLETAFDAASARSQCRIVADVLNNPGCCPPVPANARACNLPRRPQLALGPLFDRRVDAVAGGTTFPFVVSEITAGRLVLANLGFATGRVGHLVVISGFQRPGTLFVWDPYTGRRSEEDVRQFLRAFRNRGTWRASYTLTRTLPVATQ